MRGTGESAKGARLSRTTAAAAVIAVFAVLLVGLSGVYAGGAGLAPGSSPSQAASTGFVPFALANTAIDLNRSQSAGTYAPEYVTLNNSTTLTKLPAALTVTAATCKWVIVANYTAPSVPASVFHNVQFRNVTTGNDTGTTSDSGHGFRVCGGTGIWINYVYWTYSVYNFAATGLAINGTLSVSNFSDYPGLTVRPANFTENISAQYPVQLAVASNLTYFTVGLPSVVYGSTSCSFGGQACTQTEYVYVAATNSVNSTTRSQIEFEKQGSCPATQPKTGPACVVLAAPAAYDNWSASWSALSLNKDTAVGGFFASSDSWLTEIIGNYWPIWVALATILIIAALAVKAYRPSRGGKGGRK